MNNKNRKLNYLGFVAISVFVFISFFLILVDPHNFINENELVNNETESNNLPLGLEDVDNVLKEVRSRQVSVLWDATNYKKSHRITEEQYVEIVENAQKSLSKYRKYHIEIEAGNYEEANKYVYSSLWYITRAKALTYHYSVQNCINSISETIEKYNGIARFFFFLTNEDREREIELKNDCMSLDRIISSYDDIPRNNNKIITQVEHLRNNKYEEVDDECYTFRKDIIEDYNYQYNSFILKVTFLLLLLVLAFFVGKFVTLERLKSSYQNINELLIVPSDIFSEMHTEKKVNETTIKQILKLSSLPTTIATIIAIIIKFSGLNIVFTAIILVTAVVCVISLLISMLLGIISINRDSERLRRLAYVSFLFGLIFFIFIIVELFFVIGFTSLVSTVEQSIRTFLTNSTAV